MNGIDMRLASFFRRFLSVVTSVRLLYTCIFDYCLEVGPFLVLGGYIRSPFSTVVSIILDKTCLPSK